MTVIDRTALEDSPLADLHAIASELSIDGYRRLRKEQLIDAILERQEGGADETQAEPEDAEDESAASRTRRRRGRRGGRARGGSANAEREEEPTPAEPEGREAEAVVEGEVELLQNGSGFVRINPPEQSDDDVYVSAAQVKRCELIPGDRISGPKRAPRRSERFASLVRIDTLRRPSGRVPAPALRVRRGRPDDQGDRIAQPDRQGVARGHRRAGAHRKDGDPSPADGGVVKARRSQIAALAGRRPPGGGVRVERRLRRAGAGTHTGRLR